MRWPLIETSSSFSLDIEVRTDCALFQTETKNSVILLFFELHPINSLLKTPMFLSLDLDWISSKFYCTFVERNSFYSKEGRSTDFVVLTRSQRRPEFTMNLRPDFF